MESNIEKLSESWKKYELHEVINFNPRLSLSKGTIAKKIAMDAIIPFTKQVSKFELEEFKGGTKFQNGDTILARITPCLENGKTAFVNILHENEIAFGSTEYIVFREIEGISDSHFIYYLSISPKLRDVAIQSMTGSSGRQRVQIDVLQSSVFKLPPLSEQKRIAHILGSLDDKIELNRQMNQTLEQMAQALFKSWFVDFDPVIDNALAAGNPIPEELQTKAEQRKALGKDRKTLPKDIQKLFPREFEYSEELEKWVPLGWEVKVLEEVITLIGGGTPKTSIPEYWDGDIPWFSVVDAPNDSDVFVVDTEKKVTQLGVDKSSTKLLREGTTIISARGTVGKCALVGFPMTMNQSCYGIQGKDGATDIFTYYAIKESVSNLQQRGHGSVFNTITRDTFRSIKLVLGDNRLCKTFDDTTEPYLNRIKNNLIQNNELTKLRDTLLPKLISGEVRVPEIEKMIGNKNNK